MCAFECCIYSKIIRSSLLSGHYHYLGKNKYQSHNAQNRRSGEISNRIFGAYKKNSMSHDQHIYQTVYGMVVAIMCSYPPSQHAFSPWKYVLCCCAKCPRIDLPSQESDKHHSNSCPTIGFHVYYVIACCTVHGICPLDENKFVSFFSVPSSVTNAKLYTRKELVLMETSLAEFQKNLHFRN